MGRTMSETSKSSLDERGFIDMSGEIDSEQSEKVCRRILEANLQSLDSVQLFINSPGGSVRCGFAILDMMAWSRVPVRTTGLGLVASMGLLILMAGTKGHRCVTPRVSLLSHRYSWWSFGSHSQLMARRKEEDILHQRIIEHYVQHTRLPHQQVLARLLREDDTWLTGEEAVELGLVDVVEAQAPR